MLFFLAASPVTLLFSRRTLALEAASIELLH
jgi:hypothetical protein